MTRARPQRKPRKPLVGQSDLLEDHRSERRRDLPGRPILQIPYPDLHKSSSPAPHDDRRYTLTAVWAPSLRIVGWVTLQKARIGSDTYDRILRWSYLNGYGGFLLTNLYPVAAEELRAWRNNPQAHARDTSLGASHAAHLARQLRIKHMIMATGTLRDDDEIALCRHWMHTFRHAWSPRTDYPGITFSWKSVGVTEAGWPVAVATSGRTVVPLDNLILQPGLWSVPKIQAPRRRLNRLPPEASEAPHVV